MLATSSKHAVLSALCMQGRDLVVCPGMQFPLFLGWLAAVPLHTMQQSKTCWRFFFLGWTQAVGSLRHGKGTRVQLPIVQARVAHPGNRVCAWVKFGGQSERVTFTTLMDRPSSTSTPAEWTRIKCKSGAPGPGRPNAMHDWIYS